MKKVKFHGRSFVSYFSLYLFIILFVSGIVLFLAPKGRYANWVGWTLLGLTKGQWEAVHTISGYIFVIVIFFHLKYNFNALKAYVYSRTRKALNRKWELVSATLLSLLVVVGTVKEFPVPKFIMDTGERLKYAWEEKGGNPPIPHMELMTLGEIAEELDIDSLKVKSLLRSRDIEFESLNDTLKNIADENDMTPNAIYEILQSSSKGSQKAENNTHKGFYGYGRMTLSDLAAYLGILEDSLSVIFKQLNLPYERESNLKSIADKVGLTPFELVDTVEKQMGR